MSPRSRGRKRRRNPAQTQRRRAATSGQIDGDPTVEFLAALAEALEDAVDGADPLGAEMLGSDVVGQIVQGVQGGPDEVAEAFADGLMGAMADSRPRAVREQRSSPSDAGRRLPRSLGSGSSRSTPSYRVRVDLLAARPPIWRRLILPGAATLQDLHLVLQVAFDWTDDHLHVFTVGRRRYGDPHGVDDVIHEASVHLQDVVAEAGDAIEYEYDFGDSWRHRLVVEEVVPSPPPGVRCLGGRRAGPAEDSGGIWRWNELVEASRDPDHPARDDAAAMLRSDPASFDKETVDARLRRIPSG